MNVRRCLCSFAVFACLFMTAAVGHAEEPIPLWPAGSPQLQGVEPAHVPTLRCYPAPGAGKGRTAVLICPAGGYKHHSNSPPHAEWLNSLGISAYVVSYRLPVFGYKRPAPLDDARRALRIIRHNAEAWGLDPARVGVMGGSSRGPGAVSDVPVISMDVAATILDAAGIPAAADGPADGTSLVPLLQGEPRASGPLCFHYPHYAWHKANRPGGAIRDGRHKLIRRYDDDSVELYDLATDIGEAHDLATSQSALVTRLRGDLDRWLHKTGARLPEPPR